MEEIMIIEVKEKGKKEYYDEFLYIANNYRKFIKNPNKKARQFTKTLFIYDICIILGILMFMMFYLQEYKVIYVFIVGILSVAIVLSLIVFTFIQKQINVFMNMTGNERLELNNDEIKYSDIEKEMKVKWNEIEKVIINKYSICFLPKRITNAFISISTEYKEQIIEALKSYNKMDILIDNTEK